MKKVVTPKKSMQVPSTVSELTAQQFIRLAPLLLEQQDDLTKFKLLRGLKIFSSRELAKMTDGELYDVVHQLTADFWSGSSASPLKSFWHKGIKYCMPEVSHISFIDFCEIDARLKDYSRTGSSKDLDKLIAIVARPQKLWLFTPFLKLFAANWSGDYRIKFNGQVIAFHATRLSSLPFNVKCAILWWTIEVKRRIMAAFPQIFLEGGGESSPNQTRLHSLVWSLTGDQLGKYDDVFHASAVNVFSLLNHLKKDRK